MINWKQLVLFDNELAKHWQDKQFMSRFQANWARVLSQLNSIGIITERNL